MDDLLDNVKLYKYSKNKLLQIFEQFLVNSGFTVLSVNKSHLDDIRIIDVVKDDKKYKINILLLNICNSGWKDQPNIKRVQVRHIQSIPDTTKKEIFLLGGICFYKNEPLFVAWDARKFIYHKTVRSAYVRVNSLDNISKKGYYTCVESGTNIFGCDLNNFNILLGNYFDYTYYEKI